MAQKVTPSEPLEGRLTRAQIGIVAFTMLGTLGLSVFDKPAAPFAVVSLAVLLLLRFGDIASITLKAFGAEAAITRAERAAKDADRATEEADRAIEGLKRMGLQLSSEVLTLIALQGQGITATIPSLLKSRDVIVASLKALGQTQDQIDRALVPFKAHTVVNMIDLVLHHTTGAGLVPLREEIFSTPFSADVDRLKAVFAKYEILTPVTGKWLDEVERFAKTGQIDFEVFDLD